jgi:hypothetical protein
MRPLLLLAALLAVVTSVGLGRVAAQHRPAVAQSAASPEAIWCVNPITVWVANKPHSTPTICVPGP